MNRRGLLRAAGASALFGAAQPAWSDAIRAAFDTALPTSPWLLAFESVGAHELESEAKLSGTWPEALVGTLYRNGPALHDVHGFRYRHWFDGDGMLQAYRFDGKSVRHQARMIQTRKYVAEQAAKRALYPTFGSAPANPADVTSADDINPANISVLHHHGELLALWEAGSPWAMDPETLSTKGLYAFDEDTAGAPFSAHPRVEPDGTLWNFGYISNAGIIALWHIDARGQVVKVGTVPVQPSGMPHDFVVTERHIVMLIAPLHYRGVQQNFLDAHEWVGGDPTQVLVIDKNDFSRVQRLELPAQWVFHFGNAWEDRAGNIYFDAARADTPLLMQDNFRRYMHGDAGADRKSHHYAYHIDTKAGRATEAPMFDRALMTEFPTIDARVSCRENQRLLMLHRPAESTAEHPLLTGPMMFDRSNDRVSSYEYANTTIPEEHIYVPKPGSAPEQDGWVVGSALNFASGRTELNVFEAGALEDGPIASATLPYPLPLGLHGRFVG